MSKVLGIAQFAKAAGVEEATARVMLRGIGHKKKGRSYEFKSAGEIEALVKKCRSGKKEVKPTKSKKKAPAKKSPKPKKASSKEKQSAIEE